LLPPRYLITPRTFCVHGEGYRPPAHASGALSSEGLLEPVAASAPAAAAGPRLLHCWRSGCGRMFAKGQGDVDDTRACGLC